MANSMAIKTEMVSNIFDDGLHRHLNTSFDMMRKGMEQYRCGLADKAYANIYNQRDYEARYIIPTTTVVEGERIPIDDFFMHAERMRVSGIISGFCEKLLYKVRTRVAGVDGDGIDTNIGDFEDQDDVDGVNSFKEHSITHGCMEFDFDLYQNSKERVILDQQYNQIITEIAGIIGDTIDLTPLRKNKEDLHKPEEIYFHAAVIRKPEIAHCKGGNKPGEYKDSFRIRVYLKLEKMVRLYIRKRLLANHTIKKMFSEVACNPLESVIDEGPLKSNAPMILGQVKSDKVHGAPSPLHVSKPIPSEFYKLYKVEFNIQGSLLPSAFAQCDYEVTRLPVIEDNKLNPQEEDSKKAKRRSKPHVKWIYNMCYEMSLMYEDPEGYIRKPICDVKNMELKMKIGTDFGAVTDGDFITGDREVQRFDEITGSEMDEVNRNVADMALSNWDANFYKSILSILAPNRYTEHLAWCRVMWILAGAGEQYKIMAKWFTMTKLKEKWEAGRKVEFDQVWEQGCRFRESNDHKVQGITIGSLIHWAKEDNPAMYDEVRKTGVLSLLVRALATDRTIESYDAARALYIMFRSLYMVSTGGQNNKEVSWWQFTLKNNPVRNIGTNNYYKWVNVGACPHDLEHYIAHDFQKILEMVETYVKGKYSGDELSADDIAYKNAMLKGLGKIQKKAKNPRLFVPDMLQTLRYFLVTRNIDERMDRDGDLIGVVDGIVRLTGTESGKHEHINGPHSYFVSRSMGVRYKKVDWNDPVTMEIMTKLTDMLPVKDADGTPNNTRDTFLMMLSSTLRGNRKTPAMLIILLGDGANGKSGLLEFLINVLGDCITTRDTRGYGGTTKSDVICGPERAAGPDTEMANLDKSRFWFMSEGDCNVNMDKVKRLTDAQSANDKYEKQKRVDYYTHAWLALNKEPKIAIDDYGTVRRICCLTMTKQYMTSKYYDPTNPNHMRADEAWQEIKIHDIMYKEAFASILFYYFDRFMAEFNGSFSELISACPRMVKDTKEYIIKMDTRSRFVDECMRHVGTALPYGDHAIVHPIELSRVVDSYIWWYGIRFGIADTLKKDRSNLENKFGQLLKNYKIKNPLGGGGDLIIEHEMLSRNRPQFEPDLIEALAKIKADKDAIVEGWRERGRDAREHDPQPRPENTLADLDDKPLIVDASFRPRVGSANSGTDSDNVDIERMISDVLTRADGTEMTEFRAAPETLSGIVQANSPSGLIDDESMVAEPKTAIKVSGDGLINLAGLDLSGVNFDDL